MSSTTERRTAARDLGESGYYFSLMRSPLKRIAVPSNMRAWAIALALFGFLALAARTIAQTENAARHNLRERFRIRVDIGETFLRSYVQEILERERTTAELELSDAEVSAAAFNAVVHASGFKAAVVMDAAGKLVHIYPATPDLQGSDVASRYAHLREALKNGAAVSEVVGSAAGGTPIVAFAARYESAAGPRVFSGAYDVRATPLSAYMADLLGMTDANADLIDGSGLIVASSRRLPPFATPLASTDPKLSNALRNVRTGEYPGEHGPNTFFMRNVSGTPWKLIISAEQSAIYAPLSGSRQALHWLLFSGFCVAAFVAVFLLLRLRALTAMHARLARVDRLTGLANRLHLEEHMARLVSASIRQSKPFSIFIVDVDHFKVINDNYGHNVGDEVLRVLSERMAAALRAEDMLGRWGGEEFMALLPNTSAEGAAAVANRVRTMAGASPIMTEEGRALHVTVSIGCATKVGSKDVDYIQRADEALYSAKRMGRDRVVSSAPPKPLRDSKPQAVPH